MVLDPSGPGLVAASYCGPAVSLPMPFRRKQQEVVDPRAGAVERDDRKSLYAADAGSPSQHAGAVPTRSGSGRWRRRGPGGSRDERVADRRHADEALWGFLLPPMCARLYVTVATHKFRFGDLKVGKHVGTTTTGETVQNYGD